MTHQQHQAEQQSMPTRSVEVDGARVAYRVVGEGPVIVLIKNGKHPVDLPVAQLLVSQYRTFQVHPVGFGASDRPASYDFGSIDRQVLAVLDHEGVGNFVVWGFSQSASMAALVARATTRAVAFIAGGAELIGHPTDADMRRLEREPRLPVASLEFWRAYRLYNWHHELRMMQQPKLIYLGTGDPRIRKLRRLAPTLRGCACDYLEFDGLDHTTSGFSDGAAGGHASQSRTVTAGNGRVAVVKELVWATLRGARAELAWKLDGLSEYDLRRPMTPTGTNLLGVMKHLAGEEYGYLGEVFGRPAPEQLACAVDGTIWESGDMWASPEESSDYIKSFYRRACAHADETIETLEPDAVGVVPWWGESERQTTLGVVMLLMVSETLRHGGHVDVVRELIDGSTVGRETGSHEIADEPWRQEYVARLEAAARVGPRRWTLD